MKKEKLFLSKKVAAYNLQELLITLVIIGILILIALPNLMPIIAKAKSIEAQNQLKHLYTLQKNYFYMHSKYSNDMDALDFIPPTTVKNGGTANYTYQIIESSNNTFKAKAIAITDFDGDGVFNVWQINQDQNLEQLVKD